MPLREAVTSGAQGLSLKNDGTAALFDVIAGVMEDDFVCSSVLANALVTGPAVAAQLSDRELEILRCLDDGLTNAQTARRLGIVTGTVRTHLKSVRAKYLALGRDVTNAGTFVREAGREGWLA